MSELYDPNQLQDAPTVIWDANPNKYYVLTLVDIDVPTASYRSESAYKHWLVVNIPGNDVNLGYTLAEYQAPRPEPTTTHRYVILVFEQERPCNFYDIFIDKNTIENRLKFSVSAYAWKYKLNVYAGNFFRCSFVSTTRLYTEPSMSSISEVQTPFSPPNGTTPSVEEMLNFLQTLTTIPLPA